MDAKTRYARGSLKRNCSNCKYFDVSIYKMYSVNNLLLKRHGCNFEGNTWAQGMERNSKHCTGHCGDWAMPDIQREKYKELSDIFAEEIYNSIFHWCDLAVNGGNDPFHSDGVNMNLVRNHVIYWKSECESFLLLKDYPEEYYWETPPEKSNDYMARTEEIRENAKKLLQAYKDNIHYIWCINHADNLSAKILEGISYYNIVSYVNSLEQAIHSSDFITMRRHEFAEYYDKFFVKLEHDIKKKIQQEKDESKSAKQICLFSA